MIVCASIAFENFVHPVVLYTKCDCCISRNIQGSVVVKRRLNATQCAPYGIGRSQSIYYIGDGSHSDKVVLVGLKSMPVN